MPTRFAEESVDSERESAAPDAEAKSVLREAGDDTGAKWTQPTLLRKGTPLTALPMSRWSVSEISAQLAEIDLPVFADVVPPLSAVVCLSLEGVLHGTAALWPVEVFSSLCHAV
jgi:hypothetical protein